MHQNLQKKSFLQVHFFSGVLRGWSLRSSVRAPFNILFASRRCAGGPKRFDRECEELILPYHPKGPWRYVVWIPKWVVVNFMGPFWIPIIIWHPRFRVPKKGP